jgi:hypothetical protein
MSQLLFISGAPALFLRGVRRGARDYSAPGWGAKFLTVNDIAVILRLQYTVSMKENTALPQAGAF